MRACMRVCAMHGYKDGENQRKEVSTLLPVAQALNSGHQDWEKVSLPAETSPVSPMGYLSKWKTIMEKLDLK